MGQKIAKSRNHASPQNLVKWLTTRARVGKIRFFDQPYNPRMLTQLSLTRTNPGKAEAKLETGGANTLRNVRGSSLWPLDGLSAMGRMLGRLSKGFQLASPVWVRGAKLMGAIRRLWSAPAVTGVRASVRGRQLRRVSVRCPWLEGYRKVSEIISREIAGNRRGTGGLTRWLVSLWRQIRLCGSATGTSRVADSLACCFWVGTAPATLRSKNSRQSPR